MDTLMEMAACQDALRKHVFNMTWDTAQVLYDCPRQVHDDTQAKDIRAELTRAVAAAAHTQGAR